VTSSLKFDFKRDELHLLQVYLQGDGAALDHWIRTANQIGICVLKIFERVHTRRFAALGIGTKIDALSRGLCPERGSSPHRPLRQLERSIVRSLSI